MRGRRCCGGSAGRRDCRRARPQWDADRTRVEILADPPELLTWLGGDPGNRVDDRVARAEGGPRRRGPQRERRLGRYAGVRTEQYGEQACLPGERREGALLAWFAIAGDDDRVDQLWAGDAGL